MQMFIALTQSLPAFLGMAWWALLRQPDQWQSLHDEPTLVPKAIDELLRFVSPNRVQFRQAIGAVSIAGCGIKPGERLILRVDRANHDPERFPRPWELQFNGRSAGHLAFGIGPHACVAGSLIKSTAAAATAALVQSFKFGAEYSANPVQYFAMQLVASLRVSLQAWP
jgi:cytochrome P450